MSLEFKLLNPSLKHLNSLFLSGTWTPLSLFANSAESIETAIPFHSCHLAHSSDLVEYGLDRFRWVLCPSRANKAWLSVSESFQRLDPVSMVHCKAAREGNVAQKVVRRCHVQEQAASVDVRKRMI